MPPAQFDRTLYLLPFPTLVEKAEGWLWKSAERRKELAGQVFDILEITSNTPCFDVILDVIAMTLEHRAECARKAIEKVRADNG